MTDVKSILDAALALSEADRAVLAEALWDSLPLREDEVLDAELLAELERRSAEFDQGTAGEISWSELKKQL
jgi:putative addiction module component (TIGR02574 family)